MIDLGVSKGMVDGVMTRVANELNEPIVAEAYLDATFAYNEPECIEVSPFTFAQIVSMHNVRVVPEEGRTVLYFYGAKVNKVNELPNNQIDFYWSDEDFKHNMLPYVPQRKQPVIRLLIEAKNG